MDELYILVLLHLAGFTAEDEYRRALDREFMKAPEDPKLLYLESEPAIQKAALYIMAHHKPGAAFGRGMMEKLVKAYTPDKLREFTDKLYKLWGLLPADIQKNGPFPMMCSAGDPLFWGDEAQCKIICEEMLRYYGIQHTTIPGISA